MNSLEYIGLLQSTERMPTEKEYATLIALVLVDIAPGKEIPFVVPLPAVDEVDAEGVV